MILVIDTVNNNGSHFSYNINTLNQLANFGKKIVFYTKEPEIYSDIKKNIEIRPYRGYLELILFKYIYRSHAIFFLAIDTRSLLFGALTSLTGNKVYAHSHSYLQTIVDGNFKHKFSIKLYLYCRSYFLVNSEGIKHRFNNEIIASKDRVYNIGHPLRTNVSQKVKIQKRLTVSFIGKVHHNKGISKFLELADLFGEKYDFCINGVVVNQMDISDLNSKSITELEYIDCLQKTDILFCFYPVENYNLYPSGTLLDAVAFSVPIICSKINFAADVFGIYVDKFIFDDKKILELFSKPENILNVIYEQKPILNIISKKLKIEFEDFDYKKIL